jgi:hypothetical protein
MTGKQNASISLKHTSAKSPIFALRKFDTGASELLDSDYRLRIWITSESVESNSKLGESHLFFSVLQLFDSTHGVHVTAYGNQQTYPLPNPPTFRELWRP